MKKIFLFAIVLMLSSSVFAQFDPGINSGFNQPTTLAVGATGKTVFFFDNAQVGLNTTPAPVGTITIQISPQTKYMTMPNAPTTTGPNNFNWTPDGSGGWTGVNNVPMGAIDQSYSVDLVGVSVTPGVTPVNIEVLPNNPDVAMGGQLQDNILNNSKQPTVTIIAASCTTPVAPTMSASTTINSGSSTSISASCVSPATLAWTAGTTGSTSPLIVSPTNTTTYSATCTSGTCVSNATSTTVTVMAAPVCKAGTVAPSVF
jgi:hypothetical protein